MSRKSACDPVIVLSGVIIISSKESKVKESELFHVLFNSIYNSIPSDHMKTRLSESKAEVRSNQP